MNTIEVLEYETPNRCTNSRVAFKPVKRLLAASILALLAVSATLSAHALPIKNGGFESGGLAGWSTAAVMFDGGVTSAEAYSGNYCLKLGVVDIVYQDVTTLKRFGSLTFKAKADDLFVSQAYAWVDYQDGSSSEIWFTGLLSSDGWTAIELALDSTKRLTRVSFYLGESTPIYIDNVALIDP